MTWILSTLIDHWQHFRFFSKKKNNQKYIGEKGPLNNEKTKNFPTGVTYGRVISPEVLRN